jgi:hypothetical protein
MTDGDVLTLEQEGWQALPSTSASATAFYERALDDTVLMLLPGGIVLDDRAAIVRSMSGRRRNGGWKLTVHQQAPR